jgi:Asp-tRNA(Asn)/Glu-tRNA(Gln) amidotransferase A subunit family amidase
VSAAALTVAATEVAALFAGDGQVRVTGTGHAEPWGAAVASLDRSELEDDVRSALAIFESLFEVTDGRIYVAAQNARRAFVQSVFEFLAETDPLVTPTAMTPPAFGAVTDTADVLATIANTAPLNLTGHPALSVPCGVVDGAPVGMQSWLTGTTSRCWPESVPRSKRPPERRTHPAKLRYGDPTG